MAMVIPKISETIHHLSVHFLKSELTQKTTLNVLKFQTQVSDKMAYANSEDPDQNPPSPHPHEKLKCKLLMPDTDGDRQEQHLLLFPLFLKWQGHKKYGMTCLKC